jgi:hypothetical protein
MQANICNQQGNPFDTLFARRSISCRHIESGSPCQRAGATHMSVWHLYSIFWLQSSPHLHKTLGYCYLGVHYGTRSGADGYVIAKHNEFYI